MITNTFHNSQCTTIPNSKPFTCHSSNIAFTLCSTIKGHITNDHILFRLKHRLFIRSNY